MAYLLWGSLSMITTAAAVIAFALGVDVEHVIAVELLAVIFALWTLQPRRPG